MLAFKKYYVSRNLSHEILRGLFQILNFWHSCSSAHRKNHKIINLSSMQIINDYFKSFMLLILPYFGYLSKNNSSDLECKIMDSVIFNFNYWHAHSSAFIKNINNVILNTRQIDFDYSIVFLFPMSPCFGFICKKHKFASDFSRKLVDIVIACLQLDEV